MTTMEMGVSRVAAPVRAETVRVLRAAIARGEYEPGERLNEKELCPRLGVSRTTLRESLRQLEAERLIVVIPGQGPVVATVSREEAAQIYEVRGILEGLAARFFTDRAGAPQVEQLRRSIEGMKVAVAATDMAAFLAAKDEFYTALFQGTGNTVLLEQFNTLSTRIVRLRYLSLAQEGRATASIKELERVVAAIERKDATAAQLASEEHVRNATKASMERLSQSSAPDL